MQQVATALATPLLHGSAAVRQSSAQCREAYANDQGAPASLVAVTARLNRLKADQDPALWLSPAGGAYCHPAAYSVRWPARAQAADP
jgi:hypothetical protein